MHVTLNELVKYLETLEEGNYHGKVNVGFFGGKVTSVKIDASIDLEAIKGYSKEEDIGDTK